MRAAFLFKTSLASAAVIAMLTAGFAILFPAAPGESAPAVQGIADRDLEETRHEMQLQLASDRPAAGLVPPIDNAGARVTKKPFGIEIHPETSPVENDRFDGYHVGVDFETTPEEADIDVPIYAICSGPLRFKRMAGGYGGVAVQACVIDGEDVSVIYGHLRLSSVEAAPDDILAAGDRVGVLGTGESEETDGVRKHLHLGIRRGLTSDIRGYTGSEDEIGQWIDILDHMDLSQAR